MSPASDPLQFPADVLPWLIDRFEAVEKVLDLRKGPEVYSLPDEDEANVLFRHWLDDTNRRLPKTTRGWLGESLLPLALAALASVYRPVPDDKEQIIRQALIHLSALLQCRSVSDVWRRESLHGDHLNALLGEKVEPPKPPPPRLGSFVYRSTGTEPRFTASLSSSPAHADAARIQAVRLRKLLAKAGMLTSASPRQNNPEANQTVGILTALDHEFVAMKTMLDNPQNYDVPGTGMRYVVGTIPTIKGGAHSVVLALGDKGESLAAIHTERLRNTFPSVKQLFMVGIAGGVPNPNKPDDHVRLGDVVVSDQYGVVQFDAVKQTALGVEFRPAPRPPSAQLLHFARHLNVQMLERIRPWEEHLRRGLQAMDWSRPPENCDRLSETADPSKFVAHPDDTNRIVGQPRIFLGLIGSSNTLLKDPAKRDALREKFGVKAIEQETAGLADAAWMSEIGYLGVRGICDYCDSNKNDLWQRYAAMAAAAYIRALLESIPRLTTSNS